MIIDGITDNTGTGLLDGLIERADMADGAAGAVLQIETHINTTKYTIATASETEILTASFIASNDNPRVIIDVALLYGFAGNPNSNEANFWLKHNSGYINVASSQNNTANTFFNSDADYQYNTTSTASSTHQIGRMYTTADYIATGVTKGQVVTIKVYGGARVGIIYVNRVGANAGNSGMISTLKITEIAA